MILLNKLLILTDKEVSKYSIDCGYSGALSGQNLWLSSGDPQYNNYLFKLKSCIQDQNGNYYLYIKEKNSSFDAIFN